MLLNDVKTLLITVQLQLSLYDVVKCHLKYIKILFTIMIMDNGILNEDIFQMKFIIVSIGATVAPLPWRKV